MVAIRQTIPSIRAGNAVVIKPSDYTTIGTFETVRVTSGVLPKGVINQLVR